MTQEQIINMNCKKRIKIYKLGQLGLTNKAIAEALQTNPGHVYNVLKDYKENPDKAVKADLLTIEEPEVERSVANEV